MDIKGKKILLTGGAGFIGSWVAEKLVREGAKVKISVLSDKYLENLKNILGKVEIVVGDLVDSKFAINAAKDCNLIFHLASIKKNIDYHSKHPAEILSKNILMALNVLEAARINNVERVLNMSSVVVSDLSNQSPHFGYVWSKKIGEVLFEAYSKEYGLKAVSVRVPNTFGPRDSFNEATAQVIPALIGRIMNKENPLRVRADANQKGRFCYVEDVAEALIEIIKNNNNSNLIEIEPSYTVSFRDLVNQIINVSRVGLDVEFVDNTFNGESIESNNELERYEIVSKLTLEQALEKTIDWHKQ